MPEREYTEEGFGEIRLESTCAGASVYLCGYRRIVQFQREQTKIKILRTANGN